MAQEIQNGVVLCLQEESETIEENMPMLQTKDYDSEDSASSNTSHARTNSSSRMVAEEEEDVLGETIIALTREVTKRLEMERKHEYNMLKLKYEHEMEMKSTATLMIRCILM